MSEAGFFTPRLFSLDEANQLIPVVRPLLESLRSAREELANAQRELDERFHGGRGNGHPVPGGELERLQTTMEAARFRIEEAARAIAELGCELKDPDRGMVDFRTERAGRVVYFCWLMHEPRVLYWHELDGGFAGRQALE